MIEHIYLESFKAFGLPVELNLDGKSLLAYGENGSGKSSLFEALRLFFYQDRLLNLLRQEGQAKEVYEAEKQNYLRNFNNKILNSDFVFKINQQERDTFPLANHACYMLCNQNLQIGSVLNAEDYLQGVFMPTFDVKLFLQTNRDHLIQNINTAIQNDFKEKFSVSFADVYYSIKISDPTRGVSPEKDYRKYLNEAKLHLVALLLFFESLKLHKASLGSGIDILIVLDDIVTSLDATNRIFLVNYLIREFSDCQIVLLTHNVSFFNLVHLKISNAVEGVSEKWVEYNIYESVVDSKVFCYGQMKDAKAIKTEYLSTSNRDEAGNQIRRRFEAVMYEFAKLILVDCFEDSGNILARLIDKNKPVYIHKHDKTIHTSRELVDSVLSMVNDGEKTDTEKVTAITAEIEKYKKDTEVQKVVYILKELKMFQKVVMHQLSHSTGVMATFTDKEILQSLELLSFFEKQVEPFRYSNIYGM